MSAFRHLFCLSAVPVVACSELLGEVAVGQAPANAPAMEVSVGAQELPAPLTVDPTPVGVESLPLTPALEVSRGSAPEIAKPETASEPPEPPRFCEPGNFRCSGADVEFCLNGAQWIPWQTCGSPKLCQSEPAGRCIPALCAAGQQRCVDGSLQRCDEDLTGWTEVELCVTAAHCDPRQSQCLSAPCEPGQQRCNGEQLEVCDEDQLGWAPLEQCASSALCQSDAEPGAAACLAPACGEGDFRCGDSGVLQVCNTEFTGFSNVAQCATSALCNAELGRCEAPACSPGQFACTPAGELLICNAARSGFRAQQPAVVCDEETETCDAVRGVCEPIPLPPPPPPPPPPVVDDEDEDDERPRRDGDEDEDDERRRRNRDDD